MLHGFSSCTLLLLVYLQIISLFSISSYSIHLFQDTPINDTHLVKHFARAFYVTLRNNAMTKNNKYHYLTFRNNTLATNEYADFKIDETDLHFFILGDNPQDKKFLKIMTSVGQSDADIASVFSK